MSSKSTILTAFNDHFFEFLGDIRLVFPDNEDIAKSQNYLTMMRKANPKLLIQIWQTNIVGKYLDQIEHGNIDFFVNNDYSEDLVHSGNTSMIIEGIDRLRGPVKEMKPEDQAKTMKYIQNLAKLSTLYATM
jgi:hypothetical protein